MNPTVLLVLLLAAVVTWTVETVNRDRLTKRLDVMRLNTRALGRVQAEHDRLVRIQPFVGEIDSLRRDRAEAVSLRREIANRAARKGSPHDQALAAMGREVLPAAVWIPTSLMKDMGRSTPHATLQTALWAATTGSVAALKELLALEPEARIRAAEVIASLPVAVRLQHGRPELLIAETLIRTPPAGEIQILSEQLRGFDDAIEFLALRDQNGGLPRILCLRLHWEPGGWRLIVPRLAVENAARVVKGETALAGLDPFRDAPRLPEPGR